MKWLPPEGASQYTKDRKYAVVQANTQHWYAYEIGQTAWIDLGYAFSDEEAREICEDRARYLESQRKRA